MKFTSFWECRFLLEFKLLHFKGLLEEDTIRKNGSWTPVHPKVIHPPQDWHAIQRQKGFSCYIIYPVMLLDNYIFILGGIEQEINGNGMRLLRYLDRTDIIHEDCPEKLREFLEVIERNDLKTQVDQFQNSWKESKKLTGLQIFISCIISSFCQINEPLFT